MLDLVLVLSPAPDRADSDPLMAAAAAAIPGCPSNVVVMRQLPEEDLAAVMAAAAVLCAPSLSEGFGFAPLEAMACGTAVVAADRGSLPEVVGDGALLVEPAPEAIASAIGRVVRDRTLADRLRASAVSRAGRFTWEATARGWRDALEEASRR